MRKPTLYNNFEEESKQASSDFKSTKFKLTLVALGTLAALSAPEIIKSIDYSKSIAENKIYLQENNLKDLVRVDESNVQIIESVADINHYVEEGVVIPEEIPEEDYEVSMTDDLPPLPDNETANPTDMPQELIDDTKERILKLQMPERLQITMNYMIDDLKSLYKINKYVPEKQADKVAKNIVNSIITSFEASHPNDDKKVEKILAYYSQMVNECSGNPNVRGDNKQSIGIYQVQAKALPYVFKSYKRYLNEYKWIKPNSNKNFIAFSQLLSTLVQGGITNPVDYDKLIKLSNEYPYVSDYGLDINKLNNFKKNKTSKKEVIEDFLTNAKFNTMATIMFNDVNKCKLENVSHWKGEKQYKALNPFLKQYGLTSSDVPVETMAAQVTHNGMTVVKNIKYHEDKNMMSYPEKNIMIYSEKIDELEEIFKSKTFKMSTKNTKTVSYDFDKNS